MKKLFITFLMYISAIAAASAAPIVADDYVFQKQIFIDSSEGKQTCQAFRIHQNWFATAAHCLKTCLTTKGCQVKILLAQGDINASAIITDSRFMFIPKQYRKLDNKGRLLEDKKWDVALLHYQPSEYIYEYAEGGMATEGEFLAELKNDAALKAQWHGAIKPTIPPLYIYGGPDLMTLKANIIVPLWENGMMSSLTNPKSVLYFGDDQAPWGSEGFGVDHGNSGGAVMLEDGGVLGIATAKLDQKLPVEVRSAFPHFGQTDESFIFHGFAPHTTFAFIKKTMARFGDRPITQKFKRAIPLEEETGVTPVP